MKKLLILYFLFLAIRGYSQIPITKNEAAWFIDSVRMGVLATFDPNKIEEIKVVKNDPLYPNGKIYIRSKDPKDFKFLSGHDILKSRKIPDGSAVIFMLNNEIITDTAAFKIDSSFLLNVEIIRSSEIEYLQKSIPGLVIIKIFTATKENIDKQKMIRIRGNSPAS